MQTLPVFVQHALSTTRNPVMEITQVVLQQAANALQEVEHARKDAIKLYKEAAVTFLSQPLHKQVLESDHELDQQLSIALPISALYAAQYHDEVYRQNRVAELMNACCPHTHALKEAAVVFDEEMDLKRANNLGNVSAER